MYSLVLMAAIASSGDSANFHRKSVGCHGCTGGAVVVVSAPVVYSVGCYGTLHSCGGCTGCMGCSGCCGYTLHPTTCFGSSCHGCFGSSWSCMGCNGGSFGWYTPPRVAPLLPEHLTPPPAKAQSASIQIELPADAQLTVDGQTIPGTGSTRAFSTPELAGDKAFYYDMTAEITLNGVPHQETVRVVVRGGESVKQTFAELLAKTKTSAANDVARK